MGSLYNAPGAGDFFLKAGSGKNGINGKNGNMKTRVYARFKESGQIADERKWVGAVSRGGVFKENNFPDSQITITLDEEIEDLFTSMSPSPSPQRSFVVVPDIRFFDGRGYDRPWLLEIPDPVTKVAWQTPVLAHPETLAMDGVTHSEIIRIKSDRGEIKLPVYETETVRPGVYMTSLMQGTGGRGEKSEQDPRNPVRLLPVETAQVSGGPRFDAISVAISGTGRRIGFAHTDGNRTQLKRKIAMTMPFEKAVARHSEDRHHKSMGLAMNEFPLTLPLPVGYDKKRDFYPPHNHDTYRWSMMVDLDRCIGCGACSVACYVENNIGVVGEEELRKGREMSWLRVERYHDPYHMENMIFFPMMCQHCDNAPCESVCPVYAPHHSKEGLNNQIYNRCIGTRFCSQNCPYKVRRFNWFDWKFDGPLKWQLNPEVTVRSKGVMEKCSFCVQRIKQAHGRAKDENREIRDGEVVPACVQTCPTHALVFGNLMDPKSRVRKLSDSPRAYQAMGYLNTKPAVIYLKKVVRKI
jgi:Fe-S-cluster-containing dehydrogenase component